MLQLDTDAQDTGPRCTAPPCYQLWINILNEGKTTPEGDKKHLCCHSSPAPAQDRDQLQEYNRWSLSQHRCTGNIFYSQGNIISHPTNTTSAVLQKSPVCFCFVSQFQHLWDTCSSLPGCDTWHVCLGRGQVPMLSRDSPSLKIFAADSRGRSECVVCQVQKFVGAGAGYICGPQLLGYRSLQWVRDTWSGPGGSVNITHVSPIQHSEIKLNVKSFNIISHRIHYADNLVVIQGGVGTSPPQIFRFW